MKCEECNNDFDTIQTLFRHLRAHKMSSQEYVLKWKYDNQAPTCSCGCGEKSNWNIALRDFTKFIHGHHAYGRIKSDEEKKKIGMKNSKNMREYLKNNPEISLQKLKSMNAVNQTEEVRRKRKESVHKTYAVMSREDKQKFSNHTKELWQDGTLVDAHVKAAETFKQRLADGQYDFTERNDKISAAITQRYLDGGFEWSTGQYTSTKTGKTCNYRSSWEKLYMEVLDRREDVEEWYYEPFSIPYVFEDRKRRYIPDFQVVLCDGRCLIVEVKPPEMLSTEMNSVKRAVAEDVCKKNGWCFTTWSPETDNGL